MSNCKKSESHVSSVCPSWVKNKKSEQNNNKNIKNIYYVIYTERESVLYHGIKTPRSMLKLLTYRCFETVVKNYFDFIILLIKRVNI